MRNMQLQQCKRLQEIAPLHKKRISLLDRQIHNHFQGTKNYKMSKQQ